MSRTHVATLPSRPLRFPPSGSWDCHVHLFCDPAVHPLAASRRYTPGYVGPAELTAMLDRMGMRHAVVVQPSPYGDDHQCLLDGLDALSGRCVGVASFESGMFPADAKLARMDGAGVRALRVHTLRSGAEEAHARIACGMALAKEMNWHLEIHLAQSQLAVLPGWIENFHGRVVLDHMGRATQDDVDRLAALPQVWVKLSGFYRQINPENALTVARKFLTVMPHRCLWASDWPHTPSHPVDRAIAQRPIPFRNVDAAVDFDAIFSGQSDAVFRMVLCDNPAAVYTRSVARIKTTAL